VLDRNHEAVRAAGRQRRKALFGKRPRRVDCARVMGDLRHRSLANLGAERGDSGHGGLLSHLGQLNAYEGLKRRPACRRESGTVGSVRIAAATLLALVLGAGLGIAFDRVALDSERPELRGGGTLSALPDGPVEVRAETVRLATGFRSRHVHGGPTLNTVVSGLVEIADADGVHRYGPGELFFEPGGAPHSILVLETARLDVVRLLPPGAEATTEVPS
jgi:quercetin dioxygenase-like cupin family protein